MTKVAPLIEAFFLEQLIQEKRASTNTVNSYKDTFCLLLKFTAKKLKKNPSEILIKDWHSIFISSFLSYLEKERKNSILTRNTRLAAIHSFFHFMAFKIPERSHQIEQVLAIPQKKFTRNLVTFLEGYEIESLLKVVDQRTWFGRRDFALILLMIQTGLRVSEMVNLKMKNIHFEDRRAYIQCIGKGRKERTIPLTKQATTVLKRWINAEKLSSENLLFKSVRGGMFSRDAIEKIVKKYILLASEICPNLKTKNISPHSLRHTCAMQLLSADVDTSLIALYLGHESVETTQIYLHSDLRIKEKAMEKVTPIKTKGKRYRLPDAILSFLETL
ncbi:MAG: tyrosine-type recombinase/integrase [Oligoflexia bacterium]|nr:tyrosine-type recombinase/integrase [Oligoflexia bacterium]